MSRNYGVLEPRIIREIRRDEKKVFARAHELGYENHYSKFRLAIYQIEKILFSETCNDLKRVFFIGDDPAINIEEWANEIQIALSRTRPSTTHDYDLNEERERLMSLINKLFAINERLGH